MGAKTLDLGAWFIIRTATVDTIKTVTALRRRGFKAWTPIETKVGRTPRKRVQFDREIALMPSYIFAATDHLDELLDLSMQGDRDIPRFSVFTHRGGIPLVNECELGPLRLAEAKSQTLFEKIKRLGRKAPKLVRGSVVTLREGPFSGMSGVVEGQSGQFTLVSFEGYHQPIQISSMILLDEEERQSAKAA